MVEQSRISSVCWEAAKALVIPDYIGNRSVYVCLDGSVYDDQEEAKYHTRDFLIGLNMYNLGIKWEKEHGTLCD